METRVRIKSSVCNHFWAAVVPGMGILQIPYVHALRTVACPKCVTLDRAGELMTSLRRELFGKKAARQTRRERNESS